MEVLGRDGRPLTAVLADVRPDDAPDRPGVAGDDCVDEEGRVPLELAEAGDAALERVESEVHARAPSRTEPTRAAKRSIASSPSSAPSSRS
jgi:hypothetical protein